MRVTGFLVLLIVMVKPLKFQAPECFNATLLENEGTQLKLCIHS